MDLHMLHKALLHVDNFSFVDNLQRIRLHLYIRLADKALILNGLWVYNCEMHVDNFVEK